RISYFSANTSARLLHIASVDGHDAVTSGGYRASGRGETATNEEVSWSSDLEVQVRFADPVRSSPVRNAGRHCLLRNGASISTTAISGISGPVTPAAT